MILSTNTPIKIITINTFKILSSTVLGVIRYFKNKERIIYFYVPQ